MQASVASKDTETTPPITAFEIAGHKCRLQWCVSGVGLIVSVGDSVSVDISVRLSAGFGLASGLAFARDIYTLIETLTMQDVVVPVVVRGIVAAAAVA